MKKIMTLLEKIEEKLGKGEFIRLCLYTDFSGEVKFEDEILFEFDSRKELEQKLNDYAYAG